MQRDNTNATTQPEAGPRLAPRTKKGKRLRSAGLTLVAAAVVGLATLFQSFDAYRLEGGGARLTALTGDGIQSGQLSIRVPRGTETMYFLGQLPSGQPWVFPTDPERYEWIEERDFYGETVTVGVLRPSPSGEVHLLTQRVLVVHYEQQQALAYAPLSPGQDAPMYLDALSKAQLRRVQRLRVRPVWTFLAQVALGAVLGQDD